MSQLLRTFIIYNKWKGYRSKQVNVPEVRTFLAGNAKCKYVVGRKIPIRLSSYFFYTVPQKKFNIQSASRLFYELWILKDVNCMNYSLNRGLLFFLSLLGIFLQKMQTTPWSVPMIRSIVRHHVISHMIHREGSLNRKDEVAPCCCCFCAFFSGVFWSIIQNLWWVKKVTAHIKFEVRSSFLKHNRNANHLPNAYIKLINRRKSSLVTMLLSNS